MTNGPEQPQPNPYAQPQVELRDQPPIPPKTSALAIVALVLACLPCMGINFVGFILGIVAWILISKQPQQLKGKGLAIGAVAVGFLWIPILAAIAIPNFLRFQSRAKQSEAKMNLKAVYTAEKAYYAEFRHYTDDPEEHQWRPETGTRYTYYVGGQVFEATHREATTLRPPRDANPYIREESFRIVAVGNVDSDDTLDVWVIDENNDLRNVINDIDE